MSETAPISTPNKTVLILLAVIAALLVVIVGVLVLKGSGSNNVSPSTVSGTQTQPAGTTAPPADFDPATATRVPQDQDPTDFVAGYYDAVLAEDYEAAFRMQPAHRQVGDVDSFAQQLTGYGIAGYSVTLADEQGDTYIVIVDQQTASFGTFINQWTFVRHEGLWVLQDKAVTGMK